MSLKIVAGFMQHIPHIKHRYLEDRTTEKHERKETVLQSNLRLHCTCEPGYDGSEEYIYSLMNAL